MVSHRLWTTLAIIFGNLTLGFYVAIQGPTLIDLIDLLHVNNDIMSYSMAFSSLAYSVGGLLGGFLFNYIDRQLLISVFYVIFGVANILIPFMTNYIVYTVITVFKMMCAGGTDCGANVWILELWPGQDSWLQALHFTFAVGCALGPLLVEPFLSADTGSAELEKLSGKSTANLTISDTQAESRIWIPFTVSGLASILAAAMILYLRYTDPARKQQRRDRKISHAAVAAMASVGAANSKAVKPLLIPLMQVASGGGGVGGDSAQCASGQLTPAATVVGSQLHHAHQQHAHNHVAQLSGVELAATASRKLSLSSLSASHSPTHAASNSNLSHALGAQTPTIRSSIKQQQQHQQVDEGGGGGGQNTNPATPARKISAAAGPEVDGSGGRQSPSLLLAASQQLQLHQHQQPLQIVTSSGGSQAFLNQQHQLHLQLQQPPIKITSKVRADQTGRTPYYVMFAIALAAMCLSSYCGVEITSMNYLATFVVNIDLQLENRKSTAALMSSALTISFACGRGIGIWLAIHMKPHQLFYLCIGIMGAGNVAMLVFANWYEPALWASICLFGAGCGPMFPSIVSFFDDKISKVTNTVSGIFILGSMFNVALNSLIIGHHVMDNALILIYCNLIGTVLLLTLFGTLHMLTKVKKSQRVKKFRQRQQSVVVGLSGLDSNCAPISIVTSATPAARASPMQSPTSITSSASQLQQVQESLQLQAVNNNASTTLTSNSNVSQQQQLQQQQQSSSLASSSRPESPVPSQPLLAAISERPVAELVDASNNR